MANAYAVARPIHPAPITTIGRLGSIALAVLVVFTQFAVLAVNMRDRCKQQARLLKLV